MTDTSEWVGRTGQSWASEWRRTDRSFAPLTERLLARTREFAFGSALDVGCGAGELSLALARGRPNGRAIGVDVSPHLVAAARGRGGNLPNVAFEIGDAAQWWPPAGFAPELVVSRHGVMFFDDPVGAFTHLAELAAPAAGLLFSCFRAFTENPMFTELARLMPDDTPGPASDGPGPFAFADPALVEALLTEAGWRGVTFEPVDFAMIVGAGPDPVEDALGYFRTIGPAARAAAAMDEADRERLFEGVRALAGRHLHGGMVALRAACWIVTARKA